MNRPPFLHQAELELWDAAAYYAAQAPGLGAAFITAVESAVREAAEDPRRWPVVLGAIRKRLVHRFPYGVLYRIDRQGIVVVAVMHLSRHPTYWMDRI